MSTLYPLGAVLPYAGPVNSTTEASLVAAGYLPCDGRQLSQTEGQYEALFAVIGTAHGGTKTTFCVPDYRGAFHRGTDLGANIDPDAATRGAPQPTLALPGNTGDTVGSLQPDGIVAHTHNYASAGGDYHHINYGGAETPGVFAENQTTTVASGATGGAETRPKNAYVNYVIVYL